MKVKAFLAASAIACVIGGGTAAYAQTTNSPSNPLHLGRITSMRGYDYVSSMLKNKLKMTNEEINKGLNSGKTMSELAKDRGMTIEKFRKALIEEKSSAIDKAVSNGTATKEQGDLLKERIKNNINNCTGNNSFMQSGRMGGNRQGSRTNCYYNNGTN